MLGVITQRNIIGSANWQNPNRKADLIALMKRKIQPLYIERVVIVEKVGIKYETTSFFFLDVRRNIVNATKWE